MRAQFSRLFNQILFLFLACTRSFRPLRQNTNSVLLVHFAHIGDFIVWLDSAQAYRSLYPAQKIILLCRKFKDISAIANKSGLFDEIIVIDDS